MLVPEQGTKETFPNLIYQKEGNNAAIKIFIVKKNAFSII